MLHHQHIAELGPMLERLNVKHVLISPGSRNAPLTQLFTGSPAFECHSIVDERSAGYIALGMARQLQQAVVVVTTSGTAVLNLAPAVAEAYHQHIPLILFTADRPLEPIWQFNNQVVDQTAPFFSHSLGFFEMPLSPGSEVELEHALTAVEQLFYAAVSDPGGPVHVNVPLEEPLYALLPDPFWKGKSFGTGPWPVDNQPFFKEILPPGKKILVLAGMHAPDATISSLLVDLISTRQVVVVAENIANLPSELMISNPELILAGSTEKDRKHLTPDLVISFGGQVVSKRLKQFLQGLPGLEIYNIPVHPGVALEELRAMKTIQIDESDNQFLQVWKEMETAVLSRADGFYKETPFCNLTAVRQILDAIPEGSTVHLGNSATVRYSQLMPLRRDLVWYSNRGTSGIDGCVSSSVGAAKVSEQLHVLLVGDLSFVYDSNALWNHNFPSNLKIVVLNDGGGGIFRLLDGPDRMPFFEEFSVTHHPVSLELLTQSFGRRYLRASNMKELSEKLERLWSPGSGISVLEADTGNSENSSIFKSFIQEIHT